MNDLLYIASAIAPASFNDITGNNISSFVARQSTYDIGGETADADRLRLLRRARLRPGERPGLANGVLLGHCHGNRPRADVFSIRYPMLNQNGVDQASGWTSGVTQTLSLQAIRHPGMTLGLVSAAAASAS